MKIKSVIIAFAGLLILMSCLCACGGKTPDPQTVTDTQQTQVTDETMLPAPQTDDTTESTTQNPMAVELPTNQAGTLENSNMIVTDITAYDRKDNGDLVRETAMKKLGIKKSTVEKEGKNVEAYVGTYTVSEDADTVFFSLVCSLNSISDIALGREFKRADGNAVFESKYSDAKGNIYPLIVSVKF